MISFKDRRAEAGIEQALVTTAAQDHLEENHNELSK
jgi:hypothetical protein